MKKHLLFFITCMFMTTTMSAMGAVTIKKASSVSKQQAAPKMESATSLVSTAINLVSGIKALNQQVNALSAECEPTSAEINFVNTTIKEWAKTGTSSVDEVRTSLGRMPCDNPNGGYQQSVKLAAMIDNSPICFDSFSEKGDQNTIWYGYPRVGTAKYCDDGTDTCTKNQKSASDIYDIFNLIDFTEADYSPEEFKLATNLMNKIEKCSSAKIAQAKKALWGTFLTENISTIGQKQNTGSIMDAVSGVISNSAGGGFGGAMGGLQSIGGFITQTMGQQ